MDKEKIYLSPSGLATYENCPRSYYYDRVLKVRTKKVSCNLGFGGAAATAMESFLLAGLAGQVVNPVDVFTSRWREFTKTNDVDYKKGMSSVVLEEIGTALMSKFPEAWNESGYSVVLDLKAKPMIERKLMVDLGNDVVLVTKLDMMVMAANDDGQAFILDAKTPASPTSADFTILGDQLTAYQIAVQSHAARLGLPEVSGVGYWEFIKRPIPKTNRGVGPVIHKPSIVEPRTRSEILQFVDKVHDTADRIRAGKFPKTPRLAWNSPCNGCSLLALCSRGETTGLAFGTPGSEAAALALAA